MGTRKITDEGIATIERMKRVIDGDLLSNVETLSREGRTLSDPNLWEGDAAQKFRGEWPEVEKTLRKIREQLEELQRRIRDTHDRIIREDY
jgi:uncharacterized protein YukE